VATLEVPRMKFSLRRNKHLQNMHKGKIVEAFKTFVSLTATDQLRSSIRKTLVVRKMFNCRFYLLASNKGG